MIKDFENRVQMHLRSMEKHELVPLAETEKIKAYYLKEPGTRMMCALVLFTPEGIAIQGDFTPEHHDSVSSIGYGLDWFAGKLSPDYLCEKFLETKWSREVAVERLRDPEAWFRDDATDEQCEALDGLASRVEAEYCGLEGIYETFCDLGFETADGMPGYGYDPNEAAILTAIQRKFAELWARAGQYHIYSAKHPNSLLLWWRPERCGYTVYLDEAGRYTEAEVKKICDGTDNIAVPCAIARKWAKPVLDPQWKKEMLAQVRPSEF